MEGNTTRLTPKRHFLSHLYIKTNILPRQARDKHRENSKKRVAVQLKKDGRPFLHFSAQWNTLHVDGVRQVRARFPNGNPQVRDPPFLAPLLYRTDRFTKTGSGQTEGKHSKRDAFSNGNLQDNSGRCFSAEQHESEGCSGAWMKS